MSGTNKRNRVLGLVAAGLLTATALTGASFAPSLPLHAQTQAMVAPQAGFADLVERVMPAVISVEVKFANVAELEPGQGLEQQFPEDSPFGEFFRNFPQFRNGPNGQTPRAPRGGMGQGSGFVISADGYAVTNNHVVQNASEVTVKFDNGEQYQADVIGTDPKTDLALIKIKADRTFKYVTFAQKEPRVGDWVVAVGNPFGLGGTVTSGIISARGRDIGSGPYDDYLQVDAPINRGNSGGPTFDMEGNVVGVNTAIYSPSGGSVGIGFAIPASTAQDVIQSLRENGTVTRGWLGVQIQKITPDIAESLGLTTQKGAIVADVTENSPALAAGIKTGDTILKVNGEEVADPRDLAKKVARLDPGTKATVELMRDGKLMTVSVDISKMPGDDKVAGTNKPAETGRTSLAQLGLQLAPGSDGNGVTVVEVKPGSPAEEKGIKAGDVILEVAGAEVHDLNDVRAALEGKKGKVLMLVRSGDTQRFVTLPADQG